MNQILPVKAFSDNYIWIIFNEESRCATCIDPGDDAPVFEFLAKHQLKLTNILVTHHHADHVGGIERLWFGTHANIFGPPTTPRVTHVVDDGTEIMLYDLGEYFSVISVPGHTLDHIAYYNDKWLLCGDTLFSMGCGRVFEGTMTQMFSSLQKIKALPDQLQIFCAHEYTLSNIQFAKSLDQPSQALLDLETAVLINLEQNKPTLPSLLSTEKALNPFLTCDNVAAFSKIRRLKDSF